MHRPSFFSSHAHQQNLAEIKRLRTELLQHAENALLAERKNASSLLEIKKITDSRIAHMKKQYFSQIGHLLLSLPNILFQRRAEETIQRHVADLEDLKDVSRQQESAISKLAGHTAVLEETLRAKGIQVLHPSYCLSLPCKSHFNTCMHHLDPNWRLTFPRPPARKR